jgi:hypothetical protein
MSSGEPMKVDPSDIDVVKIDVAQRAHAARHAHTHGHGHAAKHTEQQTKSKGVSFSDQLEAATRKAKAKQPASSKKTDPNKIFLSHTPPKGETTAAVPGHTDYRDILSGPRNGMYVNTSGNERNGEAFVLVRRHGVEYHIYGTGKQRKVVRVGHHRTPPASAVPNTGTDTGSGSTSTKKSSSTGKSTATPGGSSIV